MMADIIHALFCNPPIAIARLGGSTAPLVAYSRAMHANPHNDDDTGIAPPSRKSRFMSRSLQTKTAGQAQSICTISPRGTIPSKHSSSSGNGSGAITRPII
jgi:hypothetical protein